jgi:hypothetical protein
MDDAAAACIESRLRTLTFPAAKAKVRELFGRLFEDAKPSPRVPAHAYPPQSKGPVSA